MSTLIGNLSVFDPKTHEWSIFYSRLSQFIKLNKISADNKCAVLLTHLSDDAYRLARNLVHPSELETVEYEELVKVLQNHFTPKRSSFADRAKFYECVRYDGESIEEFAARLRGLAIHCEFGTALDVILRDRFVLGLGVGIARDRLFEQDSRKLSLSTALEIAQQAECARQARSSVVRSAAGAELSVKEEPVYRVERSQGARGRHGPAHHSDGGDANVQRCTICGLNNHSAFKCRFKNYRCQLCGQKGHLKKVCKVKQPGNSRVHNIVASSDSGSDNDCKECQLFNLRWGLLASLWLAHRSPAADGSAHGSAHGPTDGPTDDGWGGSDRGYTFPASALLFDGQAFEYIVVGAGAGGAAAAARLALAGRDVLLVEAGADPDLVSRIPSTGQGLLGSALDWQYDTLSNGASCLAYRNRQCRFSRGRCLGGSTSINFMMYTRGSPQDFDSLNITGWAWDDVKPYFLRYEGLKVLDHLPPSSVPYHNTTGTMRLQFFSDPENPWHSRIVSGYESLNVPFNADVNAQSQVGVTRVVGYVFENERMSTARGYLARPDVKRRLKVAKLTRCTGVIMGPDNTAQGITVEYGLLRIKLRLYAKKEVILSAGALATPQILMLSGIGPAEHLKQFNIPVKLDLPVGDDLSDHNFPLVFIKLESGTGISEELLAASKTAVEFSQLLLLQKGPLTSNGLTDITTFLNSNCYDFEKHRLLNDSAECALPTLQFIHAYVGRGLVALGAPLFQHGTDLNAAVTDQLSRVSLDYALMVLSPLLLQPHSRGTVRLASRNPQDDPAIFPNFLSDDRDLDDMVRALRIIEDLMKTEEFSKNNASIVILNLEGCPSYEEDSDAYWRCYSRHMTHTTFHSVGTAALGRVVDARLRVAGARRLRVADVGVLPRLVRANTAAAACAVGERVADFILEDNS